MCTERSSKRGGLRVAPSAIDCHVHPWDEVSVQHLGGGRLEEFDRLGFEPEVRNKILVGNASALFGLSEVARA
jgi:hypothetical protein